MPPRYVVCLTATSSRREGEKIAKKLVGKRLAACVNLISGVTSFYRWKGKFCRDAEVVLLIKTTRSRVPAVEKALRQLHSYELPEFVVLPIAGGSRRYLKWVGGEVRELTRVR